jgi:hypothetical protein
VPRTSASVVVGPDAPGLADWLQQLYGAMHVYLVTPYGLAGPYPLLHGGAQGDSMGVGWYLYVGMRRTEYHRGVVLGNLHPSDLAPGGTSLTASCFAAPADPGHMLPELGYSDDRRLFSRSAEGLANLLDVAAHGCWAAGGVVNGTKLQAFCVRREGQKLVYVADHLDSVLGPLDYRCEGLALCKIPLVPGEPPADALSKTLACARARASWHGGTWISSPFFTPMLGGAVSQPSAVWWTSIPPVPPRMELAYTPSPPGAGNREVG